jgi:hypothetical protein
MFVLQKISSNEEQSCKETLEVSSSNFIVMAELIAIENTDNNSLEHNCLDEVCEIVWKPTKQAA